MPRVHRRGAHRRSPQQRGSALDKPLSRPSHISVSSEDDIVDDADVSADIPGLHEEDPLVTLQILFFHTRMLRQVTWIKM